MERKSVLYWSAQVIGWGAYFVLSVLLLYNTDEIVLTSNLLAYIAGSILVSIGISHTLRIVFIRKMIINLKLHKIIYWVLSLSLIAATILELFQYGLTEYAIDVDFVPPQPTGSEENFIAQLSFAVFRSVLLFLIWSGFYITYLFIEKSRNQEIQQLQLDASANEIELKNLRAQLNPHFLFNSLNSIRALVGLDPEQAKSAITLLSSLLRHSINLGKYQEVRLEDEIELVKSYLELEKIRFEERLQIDYQMAPESLSCHVPPLMVQTIVENSIKHGISKSIEGGVIKLVSKFENNTLLLTISNPGKLNLNLAENGVGVANTKKRLEILYSDKGQFNISQEGGDVVATIKIDYS